MLGLRDRKLYQFHGNAKNSGCLLFNYIEIKGQKNVEYNYGQQKVSPEHSFGGCERKTSFGICVQNLLLKRGLTMDNKTQNFDTGVF